MSDVFVVGVGATRFGRWTDRTFHDLAGEAVRAALSDAGEAGEIEQIWFSNCAMDAWGQGNIRGQVCLDPLMRAGALPRGTPVINVEGGCASGTAALHGAFKDIRSGEADLSLAVGVEKTIFEGDPVRTFQVFAAGIDNQDPDTWRRFYAEAGERHGVGFSPHRQRVIFLDVHAMQARHHMRAHGTTARQLAQVAARCRDNGALNPAAQRQRPMSADAVLADRPVVDPFTRSMCCPVSDGAAAVLLASARGLQRLPPEHRERAVRVRACTLAGARWRDLGETSVVARAGRRAYERAQIHPDDVDIAEVHASTAFCEVAALEDLDLCATGAGGGYAASAETTRAGSRPVNTSGGLIARGHPLGATGLAMIEELTTQLRGAAGARQVTRPARIGLQQNAGGVVGFDEALCGVTILEAPR